MPKLGTQMMVFSRSCFNNFVLIESYIHRKSREKKCGRYRKIVLLGVAPTSII